MLLEIKDLKVSYNTIKGRIQAVRGVSFHLQKGDILAIAGESGCGKSTLAQSILRLLPEPPCTYKSGVIKIKGRNILALREKDMQKIRGKEAGIIFQDPMSSLNPTMKVGYQISEVFMKHYNIKKKDALKKSVEMLKMVDMPNAEHRVTQYPHELSGGMKQRVMIAMAMACKPDLLIADEPLTALDPTVRTQVLSVLKNLTKGLGTGVLLISHDLGVVANFAHKILVMYAGLIVEEGGPVDIFNNALHPYTIGLLRSTIREGVNKSAGLKPIEGFPPDLLAPPKGCPFAPRCDSSMDICREKMPELCDMELSGYHRCACWLHSSTKALEP